MLLIVKTGQYYRGILTLAVPFSSFSSRVDADVRMFDKTTACFMEIQVPMGVEFSLAGFSQYASV